MRLHVALAVFISILLCPALKSEASRPPYLALYFGPVADQDSVHTARAFRASYVEPIKLPLAWVINYNNEGYLPGHYRDGISLQAMAHAEPFSPHWSFSISAGPYFYFDTVFFPDTTNYFNRHGLGLDFDLATSYNYLSTLFSLHLQRVYVPGSFSTTALLFGLGFQLDSSEPTPPQLHGGHHEVTLTGGRSLINAGAGQTPRGSPMGLEYRYHLPNVLDWSLSLLKENTHALSNRSGLASEIWARKNFFSNRLSLAVGIGPYVAHDKIPADHPRTVLNGLFSASAAYRFSSSRTSTGIVGRISWHRVFTSYNRDGDLFLLGLGVEF